MEIQLTAVGDGTTAVLPCGSVTLKWKRMASAGTTAAAVLAGTGIAVRAAPPIIVSRAVRLPSR